MWTGGEIMSKYKGMYIEYINNNKIYEKMYYIYHLLKEISYLFSLSIENYIIMLIKIKFQL